jgi:uncharacterized caspase-like protein
MRTRTTLPAGARWITAVATDLSGYESVPLGRALPRAGKIADARLLALAVGTDLYEDPQIPPLDGAKGDAARFVAALRTLEGTTYTRVEATTLLDAQDLAASLPEQIHKIANTAGEKDTIVFFAAGHGIRDEGSGRFYLATRSTHLAELTRTSIAWDDIAAAFKGTKARVFVFLDACQSGAAGGSANDDAVASLLRGDTSMTVIAAAKGRQFSFESDGAGRFTTALVRAITTNRSTTDTINNGVIELAELYAVLKPEVVSATGGEQTPWIARNLMVGETPLF